jgi:hypothetical protein
MGLITVNGKDIAINNVSGLHDFKLFRANSKFLIYTT